MCVIFRPVKWAVASVRGITSYNLGLHFPCWQKMQLNFTFCDTSFFWLWFPKFFFKLLPWVKIYPSCEALINWGRSAKIHKFCQDWANDLLQSCMLWVSKLISSLLSSLLSNSILSLFTTVRQIWSKIVMLNLGVFQYCNTILNCYGMAR